MVCNWNRSIVQSSRIIPIKIAPTLSFVCGWSPLPCRHPLVCLLLVLSFYLLLDLFVHFTVGVPCGISPLEIWVAFPGKANCDNHATPRNYKCWWNYYRFSQGNVFCCRGIFNVHMPLGCVASSFHLTEGLTHAQSQIMCEQRTKIKALISKSSCHSIEACIICTLYTQHL